MERISMKKEAIISIVLVLCLQAGMSAATEGTRHIKGENISLYFMNDKVFGMVKKHPIWAIYNCGTDINGEMDINGTYHPFGFQFAKDGAKSNGMEITGSFGPLKMALGKIDRTGDGFTYHVFVGEREYTFSIRYEKIKDGHMVNSIIEGNLDEKDPIRLVVDGHLCPFATTGIILIVAGSMSL
jgi:hypothetical protein